VFAGAEFLYIVNRFTLVLAFAFLLAARPFASSAASLVFTPSADTSIGLPDINGHTPIECEADTIACGTTENGQPSRVLMLFNIAGLSTNSIAGLPTNATVTNVTLRLVVHRTPEFPPTAPFSLHRMLRSWSETNANWVDNGLQREWGQPGGGAGTDFVALPSATNIIQSTGVYLFNSPTLLNEVLTWKTNSGTNFGWIILCDTENVFNTQKCFSPREASDASIRPELIIDYTTPFSIVLTRLRWVGGQFAFDFAARPGTDYIIQYKDNLSSDWQEFDYYADPGVETVFTVLDDGTAPQRFFRVLSTTTP
jgi:hypothetical protein